MAQFEAKNVRNVLLAGHSGCGKTTLAEAVLFKAGAILKMGAIADGTTASDYNDDEKEKKCSISSSLLSFVYSGTKINLIDTPGYSDFAGEIIGALRAADLTLIVVNAAGGVEFGTERARKMSLERGVPVAFFINRMDKEHADYGRCIDAINKKFGAACVPVDYPIGEAATFKGVVDLLGAPELAGLSDDVKAAVKSAKDALAAAVAETDDALLEKYLDKGELSPDEVSSAIKKALASGKIAPIFCGSSVSGAGISEFLELMVKFAPSPAERPAVEATKGDGAEQAQLFPRTDGPFSALVFKTLSDPFLGQISIFKVFSGKLAANTGFFNVTKGVREKIGSTFMLTGKNQSPLDAICAGDIGCVAKLKETTTGDSLGDEKTPLRHADIRFPQPAIAFSLKPRTHGDEDKISTALHKITAEDPTFHVTRDEQTKEMVAHGMGDMHITMMINRMRKRYGVQVDIGTPKVAYKETISGKGDAQYRHKKQTGGAGQFAEVWLRVEALERGKGFDFVNEVVGGSIPRPFIISCEKGIKNALQAGPLAGFPVVDVRAIIYDGKTHPVDSKDIAFQVAARKAFKEAVQKAKPSILEPIMDVDIVVPDECMGDITGSLNSRRGRVMGMEPGDGSQTIKAKVPLDEMYKYVNELKSITAGRGSYTMEFSHYETVPSIVSQAIVEKAKLTRKEETDE